MTRQKIVAGNWKMNGSRNQAQSLAEQIKKSEKNFSDVEVILIPSLVHLQQVEAILKGSQLKLGAQNFYPGSAGAFTGEVSGPMLVDYGCQYVLVGHSERRQLFHETLEIVANKFKAAQQVGLIPILCIGETLTEREQNKTETIIEQQLASVVEAASIDAFQRAVIAYEPVWAIGTGLTATPEQAQAVHAFIRQLLTRMNVKIAQTVRIIYGGSVKADNAKELFAMPDVDGGLVGGASLDASGFVAICQVSETLRCC